MSNRRLLVILSLLGLTGLGGTFAFAVPHYTGLADGVDARPASPPVEAPTLTQAIEDAARALPMTQPADDPWTVTDEELAELEGRAPTRQPARPAPRGARRSDRAPAPPPAPRATGPAMTTPTSTGSIQRRRAEAGVTAVAAIWRLVRWPVALAAAASVLAAIALGLLGIQRTRRRGRRRYERYEVILSQHDEAKPADLEDAMESIANVVREFPMQRARHGQPTIAFEMFYGPWGERDRWVLCILCEPDLVAQIDGAISAAYPDVRVGRAPAESTFRPVAGIVPEPGHVLRLRKRRAGVLALNADDAMDSSPPLEAVSQAQVALGAPSAVRLQLTPTPLFLERFWRGRFKDREDEVARSATAGFTEAGLRSNLRSQEFANAARRTQNRGLFFAEIQVAADTRELANRVAAALQSRHADNALYRRWLVLRQDLYRRRFVTATPPLLPTLSWRSVFSTTELAYLLELPSAKLRSVPVDRATVPRISAPPQAMRATETLDPLDDRAAGSYPAADPAADAPPAVASRASAPPPSPAPPAPTPVAVTPPAPDLLDLPDRPGPSDREAATA